MNPSNLLVYVHNPVTSGMILSKSAAPLRIKAGMESGFSPLRSLCTSFQLTSVVGIAGHGLGPLSGSELVSSLVKIGWNWVLMMLALLWLSLFRNPSSFFKMWYSRELLFGRLDIVPKLLGASLVAVTDDLLYVSVMGLSSFILHLRLKSLVSVSLRLIATLMLLFVQGWVCLAMVILEGTSLPWCCATCL